LAKRSDEHGHFEIGTGGQFETGVNTRPLEDEKQGGCNLLHEFRNGYGITASGVGFSSERTGTSAQFGGGVNAQLASNTAVFASLSYEKGVAREAANTWTGNVGVRVNF